MNTPSSPRPASTIVLARPFRAEGGRGFEVLLVKRHGRSGFMAGAHVFPGGRVEETDGRFEPELGKRCSSILDGMETRSATAFCVAALRETEEEAGVSLRAGDLPDIGVLRPWSWWITPDAEPKRFDTRFFLAEVAPGTEARVDEKEAVDHAWLTPRAALDACARREIVLAPPTLCTLEDLLPFVDIDEASASVRRPLRPICPRLVTAADGLDGVDGLVLALPGDPLHDEKERVFPNRTRIVMGADGRFASATAPARRGA